MFSWQSKFVLVGPSVRIIINLGSRRFGGLLLARRIVPLALGGVATTRRTRVSTRSSGRGRSRLRGWTISRWATALLGAKALSIMAITERATFTGILDKSVNRLKVTTDKNASNLKNYLHCLPYESHRESYCSRSFSHSRNIRPANRAHSAEPGSKL